MPITASKKLRAAVLGGSFDPIHLGHLHIAGQVLEMSAADEVWFIPSGNHRFKKDEILLDFDLRLALIQKSITAELRFKCLDLDRAGSGDGSTYQVMQKLYAQFPQHEFRFLIGMDNLSTLPQWLNFDWLKENVRFLIAVRPDYTTDMSVIAQLANFSYLNCKPIQISSTVIRYRLRNGLSIQGLVPHHLLIEITRLYKNAFSQIQ